MANSFRNIPDFGSASWKDPVDTSILLPLVGNGAGDARVVRDLNTIFIWSGSTWVQVGGGSGVVVSVNGQTGVVVLTTDDIGEGPNNKYFTNARAVSAVGVSLIDSANIDFTYNSSASQISAVVIDGSLTNTQISSSAAIAYTKLNLTNSIVNADVSSVAAIARTKIASGAANEVVVNNASGVLSSVAQLPIAQGGTGEGDKTSAFNALSPAGFTGDLITHDGTDNVVLSPGFDGTVLTADSSVPEGLSYQPLSTVITQGSNFTPSNRTINLVTTSTPRTVTLPAADLNFTCEIKDADGLAGTNPITLVPTGGAMIEGLSANRELRTNFGAWKLFSDGNDWYLL